MHPRFALVLILTSSLATAAGCAGEPGGDALGGPGQAVLGSCGLGDQVLASETLTPASIPELSALERAQIVAAVQESAHTDVTSVEEAFDRVDEHEINRIVLRDEGTNQFYVEIETYHPNPWVYDRQTFFVDLDSGAGVMITSHYVE